MNSNLQNQVSVCHKDNCVHAFGKNADVLAKGLLLLFLLIGLAAVIKAASN